MISNRMNERRNGQEGVGPFFAGRTEVILNRLLTVQSEGRFTLINNSELQRIREVWLEDDCLRALNGANKLLSILSSNYESK